eukprot:scaffold106361_cov66-Phaeocystis_antarctica.AAC.1
MAGPATACRGAVASRKTTWRADRPWCSTAGRESSPRQCGTAWPARQRRVCAPHRLAGAYSESRAGSRAPPSPPRTGSRRSRRETRGRAGTRAAHERPSGRSTYAERSIRHGPARRARQRKAQPPQCRWARASYTGAQPPSEKRGSRCCKRTTLPCSHLRRSWGCQLPGMVVVR